jgi:hypothetical protein
MASRRFGFIDTAPLAEQHHEDCEPNGRLGGRHGKNEEHEHLAIQLPEVAREGHEVEVGRQQQQLDAHQQQQYVLAIYEYAGH